MNRTRLLTTLALAAVTAGVLPDADGASPPLLRLRAAALDPGGITREGTRRPQTGLLQVSIERWTTDEEQARLVAQLRENGPEALLDDLQELPRAGRIHTAGSLGWNLHYARQDTQADGSRRVIFASDRPMNFAELWNRPQSAEYQFLFGEVRVGPDGRGRGTLVPMARIVYDEASHGIEVENYASQPVRLTDVRVER